MRRACRSLVACIVFRAVIPFAGHPTPQRRALEDYTSISWIVIPSRPITCMKLRQYGARRRRHMEIRRSGSQPSGKGPANYFTGAVRIDPLFTAPEPARAVGALVTFEPGARTAWHSHPLGQTLIVTAGCGRAQRWGGPLEEIRPGDVIWFPPGEKHWHGATATTAMTHIAIQEQLDGKTADWMEKVSDDQYQA